MTKRIVALALCVIMLFSLTSCGMLNINIGGFSDTGIREMLLSPITTVMSSDNYKISIGMMYYYYVEQYHLFMSGAKENIKYAYSSDGGAYDVELREENDKVVFEKGDENVSFKDYYSYSDGSAFEIVGMGISELAMTAATEYAKEVLIYCETAYTYGIFLDSEDQQEIDELLTQYVEALEPENVVYPEIEENIFTVLLSELADANDVRRAIELSFLASKAKAEMDMMIEGGISESDIQAMYEKKLPEENDSVRVREICCITFEDRNSAVDAIAYLEGADVSVDSFITISCQAWGLDAEYVTDYMAGDMKNDDFDAWLYDEGRNLGDITAEPIYDNNTNSYIVAYYYCEGPEHGYIAAKELLIEARAQEYENEMTERYGIETKEIGMKLLCYLAGVEASDGN